MSETTDPGSMLAVVAGAVDPAEAAVVEIEEYPAGDVMDLLALRGQLEALSVAATKIRQALDARIAEELGPNCGIRMGDFYFCARSGMNYRIKDPDMLLEWLGDDLRDVINPVYAVQTGKLKALAKQRGVEPKTILDTFGDMVPDARVLSVVPLDKAPGYAKRLSHGERTFSKARQKLGEAPQTPVISPQSDEPAQSDASG